MCRQNKNKQTFYATVLVVPAGSSRWIKGTGCSSANHQTSIFFIAIDICKQDICVLCILGLGYKEWSSGIEKDEQKASLACSILAETDCGIAKLLAAFSDVQCSVYQAKAVVHWNAFFEGTLLQSILGLPCFQSHTTQALNVLLLQAIKIRELRKDPFLVLHLFCTFVFFHKSQIHSISKILQQPWYNLAYFPSTW